MLVEFSADENTTWSVREPWRVGWLVALVSGVAAYVLNRNH
jgi:hypothetical protein